MNWPAAIRSRGSARPTCFSARSLKKALDAAQTEAGKLKDDYISTEHLLLGLLDEGDPSLKKIFQAHGLKRDAVLRALADLRGNQRVTDANPRGQVPGAREVWP
jgi:ATP-dependent Clp protease ATP-binding subunit ClpB